MQQISNGDAEGQSGQELLSRSALYREVVAEREEILRHKWLESERVGRDIGFNEALTSWVIHHRAKWRRERPLRLLLSSLAFLH